MKVGIYGAGAIGGYLGASLLNASCQVLFVGRERLRNQINNQKGIFCTSCTGKRIFISQDRFEFSTSPKGLMSCDVILVCLKYVGLEDNIRLLRKCARKYGKSGGKKILLIPLQNGVRGKQITEQHLGKYKDSFHISGGLVVFGVNWTEEATFHRSTAGPLFFEETDHPSFNQLVNYFSQEMQVKRTTQLKEVMYGKLLINLINPINALSGRTIGAMLEDDGYRLAWISLMKEGLDLLKIANITPVSVFNMPTTWITSYLSSPLAYTFFKQIQKIDKKGFTSMAQDIQNARKTEIDYLAGEFVLLAAELSISEGRKIEAPINAKVVQLVKQLEADPRRVVSSDVLVSELGLPRQRNGFAVLEKPFFMGVFKAIETHVF